MKLPWVAQFDDTNLIDGKRESGVNLLLGQRPQVEPIDPQLGPPRNSGCPKGAAFAFSLLSKSDATWKSGIHFQSSWLPPRSEPCDRPFRICELSSWASPSGTILRLCGFRCVRPALYAVVSERFLESLSLQIDSSNWSAPPYRLISRMTGNCGATETAPP